MPPAFAPLFDLAIGRIVRALEQWMMPRMKAEWELADAFVSARYWLPAQRGGGVLRFDARETNTGAAARAKAALPRGTWAIVSAANPWSMEQSVDENAARTRALADELRCCGIAALAMRNSAADGGWDEESFLVDGVSREKVLELCWRFGQAGADFGIGAKAGLLWTRSGRWVALPAIVSAAD